MSKKFKNNSKKIPLRVCKEIIFLFLVAFLGVSCSKNVSVSGDQITTSDIAEFPSLKQSTKRYIAPLADKISRIDPFKGNWETESFSELANKKLKELAKNLENSKFRDIEWDSFFHQNIELNILPESLSEVYEEAGFTVQRTDSFQSNTQQNPLTIFQTLFSPFSINKTIDVELKLFRVEMAPSNTNAITHVYFHVNGPDSDGRRQLNAEWIVNWDIFKKVPRISSIQSSTHEIVIFRSDNSSTLFADATESVIGHNHSYRNQLLYSTDYWRSRLPRELGLDAIAHHGMAIGDVNGDMLEDLYFCQQGGLPNKLFIQNINGTIDDYSEESQTNWLDFSTSALFADLDNDGDQDLAVSLDFRIVLMANDGHGRFMVMKEIPTKAQTFSLAIADYDLDGDLDIFACGYNASKDKSESSIMGNPMPYHDANNGGENLLFQQSSKWNFRDVTKISGLNINNNRFSFAASWVDFDMDGDQDLYVANDYGRNNFYVNNAGKFHDEAAEFGIEDMSAGMSVDWADINRDGALDLYVSNMFSAAGNRITFQRKFRPEFNQSTKLAFQRHARGNSLFLGSNHQNIFQDVSEEMGVTMGRWAWSSRFVDINNDGWEDIVVANGFISTEDTGDL